MRPRALTEGGEGAVGGVGVITLCWTSTKRLLPAQPFNRLRCLSAYGGRDEEALQSKWRTNQGATSQGGEANTPQCAEGRCPFQFILYSQRG